MVTNSTRIFQHEVLGLRHHQSRSPQSRSPRGVVQRSHEETVGEGRKFVPPRNKMAQQCHRSFDKCVGCLLRHNYRLKEIRNRVTVSENEMYIMNAKVSLLL